MNITAFEYEDSIVVVDCGLCFPADDMLGIDLVIPDITYLIENIKKVKGFVFTHGHEDHIGALPYILKQINVPLYATRLTMALIENKLKAQAVQICKEAFVMCTYIEIDELGLAGADLFVNFFYRLTDGSGVVSRASENDGYLAVFVTEVAVGQDGFDLYPGSIIIKHGQVHDS
jgi:hypothetical protein